MRTTLKSFEGLPVVEGESYMHSYGSWIPLIADMAKKGNFTSQLLRWYMTGSLRPCAVFFPEAISFMLKARIKSEHDYDLPRTSIEELFVSGEFEKGVFPHNLGCPENSDFSGRRICVR